jgi:hypothetical protein
LSEETVNQLVGNIDKVFNAMEMKVPAQVAEMVEANLEQARAIYEKVAENVKSYGEAANIVVGKQQALAREFNNRLLENVNENLGAALDVAQKLARARSIQDMLKIQTEFVQTYAKRSVEQANENLSLVTKAGSDALTCWSSAFTGLASK